ncbi:MAG: GNAT family N-acetyltransferase [Nitrospirae bacterium]|nr:GNAT family N-acetyltransferase [Nitrospirota bacterium]
MNADIRPYTEDCWNELRGLLKNHWREDHPLLDRALFEWQYKGYGPLSKSSTARILFVQNKLIGFLGSIPGLYQIPYKDTKIVPGLALALWLVRPDYRGGGLGILMLLKTEELAHVLVCLGANNDTIRYLSKRNFTCMEALLRYILPLDAEGYKTLMVKPALYEEVLTWTRSINPGREISPIAPDTLQLQALWERSTDGVPLFSLYRNEDFWRWRYIESAGFKYLFFGEPNCAGIVVSRIERIYSPENNAFNHGKVLRIIELIPGDSGVWHGKMNADFIDLIRGVLSWARREGCWAADFQCTSSRLRPVLLDIGFKQQDPTYNPPLCSLAGLFQPLKFTIDTISVLWRINFSETIYLEPRDTYLVKSDGDTDRPNIWPLPA